MNPTAWPRAQRLQSAVAELVSAEAATDPRLRRGAAQRALALEPMVALSQRWSRALAPLLAGLPVAPGAGPGRRFLVVTSEPFAADRGGAARYAHDVLAAVLAQGHAIDVYAVPGAEPIDAAALAALQPIGPVRRADAAGMARIDALICLASWSSGRLAMLSGMTDLLQLAAARRLPLYWLAVDHVPSGLGPYVDAHERRALDDATARLASQAQAVAVVSVEERARFATQVGESCAVHVLPPLLHAPVEHATRAFAARADIAFVGSAHASNAEGLHWFLDAVWPALRGEWPDLRLHLYGRGVEQILRAQDRADAALHVVGAVPDLVDALTAHRLTIAPMRQGGGIRIKVLDSFAAGTPAVATPLGAAGLDWPQSLPPPAETPAAFAAALLYYGRDAKRWQHAHDTLMACASDPAPKQYLHACVRDWLAATR